jgi:hypothetical protein
VIDRVLCSTIVCVFIAGASACARSEPPQSAETPPVASAEEASIDAEVGEEVVEVGEEVVEGDEEMAEGDEEAVRKRLADELEESIEAERRELRAQCERGDQKACVEAVCFELIQAPTERKYRDCATVQEFTTTDLWVQMSALRVSYDNRRLSRSPATATTSSRNSSCEPTAGTARACTRKTGFSSTLCAARTTPLGRKPRTRCAARRGRANEALMRSVQAHGRASTSPYSITMLSR